jgi:putative ABC transport system ATP-binding protein
MTTRAADGAPEPVLEPVLELRAAAKTYAGAVPVHALKPVDLTVAAGDYVTITGASGSGKSTLLNLIGLLDAPSSGQVMLLGHATAGLAEREVTALRANRIGFVFQAFHLLPRRSAVENVALALTYRGTPVRRRLQRAEEALERVGLAGRRHALPAELSGGEKQRVAIARAVVGNPALLLCDEPTGNLDMATSTEVLGVLEELNASGTTLLTITHDPGVAGRGRRRLDIVDGVVTERPVGQGPA